jgi:2-hydroxychromene-2-carboxylate isomerase
MAATIDYYFFTVSPYAYMGHRRLGEIARRHNATIRVCPMDAAKVFPVSGGVPLAQRPKQRQEYRMVELKRWRAFLDLPMNLQPKFFPAPGNDAARLIVAAAEQSQQQAFDLAGRVLAAVWERELNIADAATLSTLVTEAGLDAQRLATRAASDEIAARYDALTQEAIERQVFGAPTFFIDGEMFWGQDRLDFVERKLAS